MLTHVLSVTKDHWKRFHGLRYFSRYPSSLVTNSSILQSSLISQDKTESSVATGLHRVPERAPVLMLKIASSHGHRWVARTPVEASYSKDLLIWQQEKKCFGKQTKLLLNERGSQSSTVVPGLQGEHYQYDGESDYMVLSERKKTVFYLETWHSSLSLL